MFFDSWADLFRTFIISVAAYASLIILLRTSGKRSIAKLNIFDWVVTVALGSTLATVILSKDVALAEGVVAFASLIGLQYVLAWSTLRSKTIRHLVKSDPRLLFYRGRFLNEAMRDERIVEAEVRAVVREQGIASLEEVEAVVLETNGGFSVVPSTEANGQSAFSGMDDQFPDAA